MLYFEPFYLVATLLLLTLLLGLMHITYYCFYSYLHYICDVMSVSERRICIRHVVPRTW
jgi:hypothetical protein